jgi:copper(I)-binding protein
MNVMKTLSAACAAALFLAAGAAAAAPPAAAAGITVANPWVVASDDKLTTAFMKIENGGAADQALVSIDSDAAHSTQIHEPSMRQVDRLVVPAHGSVELKSGGRHVMLLGLHRPLAAGDEVHFTLHFASGLQQKVTAKVRKQ